MRACCLVALAAIGCATAGNAPSSDGPPSHDAPHVYLDAATDAPRSIDAPLQSMCTSAATCATATALGSVSGDTGNDQVQATGYQHAWFSVRVTENDSGIFGVPMNVTVQLTSPAGVNYDVYLYVNTGSDVLDCTTVSTSSTSTSTFDSAHLQWGETGTFANNSDDSRTLSIEVRPVSGTCAPGSTYKLVVLGDV